MNYNLKTKLNLNKTKKCVFGDLLIFDLRLVCNQSELKLFKNIMFCIRFLFYYKFRLLFYVYW